MLRIWSVIEKALFWCAFLGVPAALLALIWLFLTLFWDNMPSKWSWYIVGFGAASLFLCLIFPYSIRERLDEDKRIRGKFPD